MRFQVTETLTVRTIYLVEANGPSDAEMQCTLGGGMRQSRTVIAQTMDTKALEEVRNLAEADAEDDKRPADFETWQLGQFNRD